LSGITEQEDAFVNNNNIPVQPKAGTDVIAKYKKIIQKLAELIANYRKQQILLLQGKISLFRKMKINID